MEKPKFDKRIFWDVDFESLDYDKEAYWIIGRVFEWGKLSDLKNLLSFYPLLQFSFCKTELQLHKLFY